MYDLSVLIPSRHEMFLNRTVQDVLENSQAATEVVVGLDGEWPVEPIPDHERVTLVHSPVSVGQRAITNDCARVARGWYVMKLDAHCAVAPGFDLAMLEAFYQAGDDVTMAPTMRNLHVFDWVCPNGHRRYQGPSGPCQVCGEPTERDVVWIAKTNPQSNAYCFDAEPHFQYFREFSKRPEGRGDLTETMSLQGSCWMLTKERYFELDVCDESWGSWGSQGIEVACKTWLSGGRCLVNHRTWYAHCFRTQGGDFGFPYSLSGRQVEHAKKTARATFFGNRWPGQTRPLSWLVERFWPVPGWTEEALARLKAEDFVAAGPGATGSEAVVPSSTPSCLPAGGRKGILYYTDNRLDPAIEALCRAQLLKAGLPVVCVSLKPVEQFAHNIVVEGERGPLTLHRQILAGLEAMGGFDAVFFAEHDVLYHPSHWRFELPSRDVFWYNTNVWRARWPDGHAVWTDDLQQTSGLCAARSLLLEHYRRRVARIEAEGFDRHYEPGPKTGPWRAEGWRSEWPNVDVRHPGTLTRSKWSPRDFRNPRYARGWKEADEVPGWGRLADLWGVGVDAPAVV